MEDFISTDHMEVIHPKSFEACHYLPHHGVLKMESTSTKLRPVFTASCQSESGMALNDVLCVGLTIQAESYDIMLRFREGNYVLMGDVTKMY